MKIEKNNISISGKLLSLGVFKNLNQGSRLSALISEKLGPKNAVLNIGGSKVNAEFLRGVPESRILSLILENKTNGIFYFRIEEVPDRGDLLRELNRIIISDIDLNESIHRLRQYLKEGNINIAGLNIALLGNTEHKEKNNKTEKIKDLFNKLLLKGAEYKNLFQISALLHSGKSNIIQRLYYLMAYLFPDNFKYFSDKNNKITERLLLFTELIDKSFNMADKTETIQDILDFVAVPLNANSDLMYDKILFFDENKFKTAKYIINKNNVVLSVNLSQLGNIDIIIKKEKSYHISFYCESDAVLKELKSGIKILESSVNMLDKNKIYFNFYNNKKEIEKIIEIISFMDSTCNLDVKV